ncbi:MAG: ATP-binding protein, partial [Candidatus Dadabacteria bacterium]
MYGKRGSELKILVTGSAKLDFYRYSGDSLQGRYFFYRLHPFSVAELKISSLKALKKLLELSGFPEPYLSNSKREFARWTRQYRSLIIREDLKDLERTTELNKIELLSLRLPELVGSPLSLNSLREDLNVSHRAVTSWCNILERLYFIFRLSPFGAPSIKAVKKERKHYLYN